MKDKVTSINKSIEKWEVNKKKGSLSEAVEDCTIDFRDSSQGIEVLAYAATARALGLSNRDLQPRRLSNYLRSGYLQVQLISSVILFQFRGDNGVSRDDLYDSITDVFPAVTFANFRKVLATGVDSEIFIREKDIGGTLLTASQVGQRIELDSKQLFLQFVKHPLMTFKVILAIHFEAFRLWIKGIKHVRKKIKIKNDLSLEN